MAWWTRTKGWLADLPRWQEMINQDRGGAIEQGLPFLAQEMGNAAISGLEGMWAGTGLPAMYRGEIPFNLANATRFHPHLAANAIRARQSEPLIDYFSIPETEGGQGVLEAAQWAEQPLEAAAQSAAEGVFALTENPALAATTLAAGGIVPIPGRGRGQGRGFLTLEDINAAAPANRPPMVSRLENDLATTQTRQTPEQWAKWAEKSGNLYEANERGLTDWLSEQEGTVSREQVEGYLAEEGQLVPFESVLADAAYGQTAVRDVANQNLRLVENPDGQIGMADSSVQVLGGNGSPVGQLDILVSPDGYVDGFSGKIGETEVSGTLGEADNVRYGEPGWEVALRERVADVLVGTDIERPEMGLAPIEGTRPRPRGSAPQQPPAVRAAESGAPAFDDMRVDMVGGVEVTNYGSTLPDGSRITGEIARDDNGDWRILTYYDGQVYENYTLDEDPDIGDAQSMSSSEAGDYLRGQIEELTNQQMQTFNEGAEVGGGAIPDDALSIGSNSYILFGEEPRTQDGDAFIVRNAAGDEVFVDIEYQDITPDVAADMGLDQDTVGRYINIRTYDADGEFIEEFGPMDSPRIGGDNIVDDPDFRFEESDLAAIALDIIDDPGYEWGLNENQGGGAPVAQTGAADYELGSFQADEDGNAYVQSASLPDGTAYRMTVTPQGEDYRVELYHDGDLISERYLYDDDLLEPGREIEDVDDIADWMRGELEENANHAVTTNYGRGGTMPAAAQARTNAPPQEWQVPMIPRSPSPQHSGYDRSVHEGYGERALIQQGDTFYGDQTHLTLPRNPRTGKPFAEGMLSMSREGWGPTIQGERMWLADEVQSPRHTRGSMRGWREDPYSVVEQALMDIRDREDVSQLPLTDRMMIEDVERKIADRVPPTPGRTGGKWVEQQLAQGLGEAVSRGADYFGWNTASGMRDRWPTEGALFDKIYDKAGPKSKIFRRLGLKPERIDAADGNTYWAIRLTPEIKDRLIREGIPYYALGGMAILGAAGEDEDAALGAM